MDHPLRGSASLPEQPKKKNNHFVPQSYLQRFCSKSARQVALYNLRTGRTVETAPIKNQCSRDYFYTKDPVFENAFEKLEREQKRLLDQILVHQTVPEPGSSDRSMLSSCIMFQAGRTITTADNTDHLAELFGKALLRRSFEKDGRTDLLDYIPEVKISIPHAVMDSIGQHLVMYPLIDDLDCTLLINESKEDFLTSDHPIAKCNNLPATWPGGTNTGFASRGLIILFPLSPRALLFLSDREVYLTDKNKYGVAPITKSQEVVELNLSQCVGAHENFYFKSHNGIVKTLEKFQMKRSSLRTERPKLKETPFVDSSGHNKVLLEIPSQTHRLNLPKMAKIKTRAKKGDFELGDLFVRDRARVLVVKSEAERLNKLRELATQRAKDAET